MKKAHDIEPQTDTNDVYEKVRPGERIRAAMKDGRTLHVRGVPWWDHVLALVIAALGGAVLALLLSAIVRTLR